MKKIFFIFIFISLHAFSWAQSFSAMEILDQQPIPVKNFKVNRLDEYQLALRTNFAEYNILNSEDLSLLEDKVIYGVSLIYTRYSSSEEFNQYDLNRNRIQELQMVLPKAFEETVSWTLLEHIDCNSVEQGKKLFHGFIITYRPHPDSLLLKKEISLIRKQVIGETKKVKDTLNKYVVPEKIESSYDMLQMITNKMECCYPDSVTKYVSLRLNYVGYINEVTILNTDNSACDKKLIANLKKMPQWNLGIRQTYETEKYFEIPLFFNCAEDEISVNSFFANDPADRIDEMRMKAFREDLVKELVRDTFDDKTIFNVFARNRQWTNMTVVCDITGSMAKYTSQFLYWLKNNLDNGRVKRVVFFNDGDTKETKNKIVGFTGGVYMVEANNFDNVFQTCLKAMEAGQGGDIPENDIEALIEASSKFPDIDTLVLIGDNYATPRDLTIVKDIKVPVRVILCGNENATNTTYLDLAKATSGSFHTAQEDFFNMSKVDLGDKVKIYDKKYKFDGVKFRRATKLDMEK